MCERYTNEQDSSSGLKEQPVSCGQRQMCGGAVFVNVSAWGWKALEKRWGRRNSKSGRRKTQPCRGNSMGKCRGVQGTVGAGKGCE